MEGQINKAYVSDNGEEIDYAYLDDTVDMEFYRSKLVIDFSKENICDNRNDNHRSKHITDRVEFETAHKSPDGFSQNSVNEQRNEISQHYIINKRNHFGSSVSQSLTGLSQARVLLPTGSPPRPRTRWSSRRKFQIFLRPRGSRDGRGRQGPS